MNLLRQKDRSGYYWQWGAEGKKFYFDPRDVQEEERAKRKAMFQGYEEAKAPTQVRPPPAKEEPSPITLETVELNQRLEQVSPQADDRATVMQVLALIKPYLDAIEKRLSVQRDMIDALSKRSPGTGNKRLFLQRDENGLIKTIDVKAEPLVD